MVPVDLGQLCEGFAFPPQGHHGSVQPLRNADNQSVLQRLPAAAASRRGIPQAERGLWQVKGSHQ